ncbi:hypothetical protein THITH_07760 [Thioalkalivibrio paradoxus ARh 1]|uniref:Uncharacterized protein n=1 Tax=Thioalkalivibrio paradoxus ARh 1 TaxID=713585 RepID=W0DRZ6_9GAMM|nr:hypothetical protein THITH_07760 [Thioalkalivibrio paradoxus ARh 1]
MFMMGLRSGFEFRAAIETDPAQRHRRAPIDTSLIRNWMQSYVYGIVDDTPRHETTMASTIH